MDVTEIRIKLAENREDRLQAFCCVTFDDCFVIRDIKVIRGGRGPFVAMPCRKIIAPCPKCRARNHLRARYCNECGFRLPQDRVHADPTGRPILYADVAHPVHAAFREELQCRVLQAYEQELLRAQQPGYKPPPDFFPDLADEHEAEELLVHRAVPAPSPPRARVKSPHTFGEGIFP